MSNKIEISYKTIIFIVSLIIGLWFVVQIRDIIITLFISFILVSALNNLVLKLISFKIPRTVALILIYLFLISIIVIFLRVIFPPLINESMRLAKRAPQYTEILFQTFDIKPDALTQQVSSFSSSAINVVKSVFSDIFALLSTLVITFYLLLERRNMDSSLVNFFGEERGKRLISKINKIEYRLGGWIRGQVLLCTMIGIACYVGLRLLGIEYALPLALIAAVLEIVPVIGPIISAIPAVIIAYVTSPSLAIAVIALYTLIQQLENHLIVPSVMKTAVGLKPIVTIIALMVGGKLLGIAGAVLAIPILIVIMELSEEIMRQKGFFQETPVKDNPKQIPPIEIA
jgi:predicted PurR-regulated permease PerM